MCITPEEIFFNDIIILNKNITKEQALKIYSNCLEENIKNIYTLKTKRINIMAKYQNIKLHYNLDNNAQIPKNHNQNKINDNNNNKENINSELNIINNINNIIKEKKYSHIDINNTTKIFIKKGKLNIKSN